MVKRRGMAALALGMSLVLAVIGCAEEDDFLIGGKRPASQKTPKPGASGGTGGNGGGSDVGGGIGTGDKPVATPTPAPTPTPTPAPTPPSPGTIFTHVLQFEHPEGIAFDAEGNAWIACYGPGNTLSVVTKMAPDGTLLGEPPVGIGPKQVVVDPQGNAWVANSGSNTVTRIARDDHQGTNVEVAAGPRALAITPDGKELWVAAETVVAVDLATQATRSVVPHAAVGIAFQGDKAWIAYQESSSIGVYAMSGALEREVALGTPPGLVRANSDAVWVLTYNGAMRIDPETDAKRSIPLDRSQDLVIGLNGDVWISQADSPKVARYKPNGDWDAEISIGLTPHGLAFHPMTGYLWVTDRSFNRVRVYVP
ncbi:Virginiamycin B lyase [compost metagenome]